MRRKFDKKAAVNVNLKYESKMTCNFGYKHQFTLELIDTAAMPQGHGRAYPKILDGTGRGMIEDIPASELLEIM